MIITAGKTNVTIDVYFVDDDGGTAPGEPTTGLLFSDIETGGSASYHRQGAARVDFTLVTLASASAAHTDGGFILVDDTNMPGLYRLDVPDAAFVTGVDYVTIQLVAASGKNSIMRPLLIDLTDVDLRDSVRGGMTALPNAAADGAGGLPISDLGGLDLDTILDVAVSTRLAPTTAARTLDILATGEVPIDFDTSIGTLAAAQIEASALDGKGDWNVGKTGYSLAATGLDAIASTATGMVEIAKAIWDRVLTGATHNIADSAGRRLRDLQEFGVYEKGAIWIDTVNGAAGTTTYENGTNFHPVLTLADAITLAAAAGLSRFEVAPGSTITFAETHNNEVWEGDGWTLALGGQDVGGTHFHNADVSGTGTGSSEIHFKDCSIGTCTLNPFHLTRCDLTGTITMGAIGSYTIGASHSGVAGMTTPIIDMGAALGNVDLAMPDYYNGIEIRNLNATGTDTFSISGIGQIIYAASSSGAVSQRGDWKVTNTGGVTITEDDNTANLAATLADTANMQPKLGTPVADIAADIATAQADLDILTGADGVILASAQGPVTFTGVTDEAGITLVGNGTGPGLKSTGGATGHGASLIGGATSGDGLNASAATDGNGIDAVGVGANAGLRLAGGATGPGLHAHGGATGATPGVEFHAHSTSGDALELEVDGSGDTNADLADIRSRIPAALVGGAMDSDVSAMQANVITAAAINAAALTAAKFAAGAIDANALAADAAAKIRDAILPTQNVAFDNIYFLFVAASDHVTPVTGATGTAVTRSIDGGAFASGTGTLAEVANGIYQYDASAADMNGGKITFRFTASGGTPGAADDRFITVVTGGGV